MRPFPNTAIIDCERNPHFDYRHEGAIRNAAYPGSITIVVWHDDDRRTFTGEWSECDSPVCVLPAGHRGNHSD